jgi:DNA-directed RNA polymerase specialized sigma24 family protein
MQAHGKVVIRCDGQSLAGRGRTVRRDPTRQNGESLTPAERPAWVLHDLFGVEFTEVADIVGRTPGSVRRLAARARPPCR